MSKRIALSPPEGTKDQPVKASPDYLDTLSDFLLKSHSMFGSVLVKARPLVFVAVGDVVTLYCNPLQHKSSFKTTPAIFEKVVKFHNMIMLPIENLSKWGPNWHFPIETTPSTHACYTALVAYKGAIKTVRAQLKGFMMTPQMLGRQETIIDGIEHIVDHACQCSNPECTYIKDVWVNILPHIMKDVEEIAFGRLANLDKKIKELEELFSPASWLNMAVVVAGSTGPEIGGVMSQFFSRLTGKPNTRRDCLKSRDLSSEETEMKKNMTFLFADSASTDEEAQRALGEYLVSDYIRKNILGEGNVLKIDLTTEIALNSDPQTDSEEIRSYILDLGTSK